MYPSGCKQCREYLHRAGGCAHCACYSDMMVFVNWAKYCALSLSYDSSLTNVCLNSDVLSFYKEELANDTHNHIHERVEVTGKEVVEVLSDVGDEAATACDKVRAILQGRERDAWESFVAGYIVFHRYSPRYRLHELFGDEDRSN